jgi:hypothetical protein
MNKAIHTVFEVQENTHLSKQAVLIVDKTHVVGALLSQSIRRNAPEVTTVLVTQQLPSFVTLSPKTIAISFGGPYPKIPNASYAYIFIVYNGEKEVATILPQFINKARADGSFLVLLCESSVPNHKVIQQVLENYKKSQVFVFGDLFGKHIPFDLERPVGRMLYEATQNGKVKVYNDGLKKTYPVSVDDVVSTVLSVSLEGKGSNNPLLLLPKHAPTELALARFIQKAEPFVGIDFANKQNSAEYFIPEGQYILGERYPLEKRIKRWVEALEIEKGIASKKKRHPQKQAIPVKKPQRQFSFKGFFFLFFLFSILLPYIVTFASSMIGLSLLSYTKEAVEKGDMQKAKDTAYSSSISFSLAKRSAAILAQEMSWTGRSEFFTLRSDLDDAYQISVSASDILAAIYTISTNKNPTPVQFMQATQTIKRAIVTLQTVEAEQESQKNSVIYNQSEKSWVAKAMEEKSLQMQELNKTIHLLSPVIDVAPQVLGVDKEKTYLVLFQNNMELRPGGGFIGSYGLLKVKNARLEEFTIHDTYDADGQLKGHVEPPFAIRRYLPSVHWYLRDSNFNVDFKKSAESAAFLLSAETGQTVDGVIGVDVSFLKMLLAAIGPVHVPEYNETVDSQTLYQKVQTHAEKDFFPGSTQKKDFLRSLANALQNRITTDKNLPFSALGNTVLQSAIQKHVLFVSADEQIENVFAVNGLSSSLWDSRSESTTQLHDFLGVIDANLGVNKINTVLKRSIKQDMIISSTGTLEGTTTVTYNNSEGTGEYKNFVRFVLPQHSVVTTIAINGENKAFTQAVTDPVVYENKKFKAPKELEVETVEQDNKTIVGFLVTVPKNDSTTVSVAYSVSDQTVDTSTGSFGYSLKLFKQPGTEGDPYTLSLAYPSEYKILQASQAVKTTESGISFATLLMEDKDLSIDFTRR